MQLRLFNSFSVVTVLVTLIVAMGCNVKPADLSQNGDAPGGQIPASSGETATASPQSNPSAGVSPHGVFVKVRKVLSVFGINDQSQLSFDVELVTEELPREKNFLIKPSASIDGNIVRIRVMAEEAPPNYLGSDVVTVNILVPGVSTPGRYKFVDELNNVNLGEFDVRVSN